MAGDDHRVSDFVWEPQTMRGTFSQLLFSDDMATLHLSETNNSGSGFSKCLSPYSKQDPPKMLCFGNSIAESSEVQRVIADPGIRRSDSKGCLPGSAAHSSSSIASSIPTKNRRSSKRSNPGNAPSSSNSQTRGRRENKLGERIAALQLLVSPYGKTDTASVLHEAMGYIRFLHEQVQVLCSPYLQQLPSAPEMQDGRRISSCLRMRNLRTRGLCLVPLTCITDMAACNGADFWSPATCSTSVSSLPSLLHR